MYDDINQQLNEARQNIFRVQKIDAMLKSLTGELQELERKEAAARALLDKENRDYERLREVNITTIFYNVLGKLDEREEKERREALDAELKHNQAAQDLNDVKERISKLKSEKLQYGSGRAQETYDNLYKQKLRMLMEENSQTAGRIMELNSRMEQSNNNMREIDEAMAVGREVLANLDYAMEHLDSAEGWGVWDMLGGGFISGMAKHSHIDDAGNAVRHTQNLLRKFRTELADVQISDDINIEVGGFAKFADFFFDGLIADWFMQSKINASQENVRNTRRQVESVMGKLSELRAAEERTQPSLRNELDNVVVGGN